MRYIRVFHPSALKWMKQGFRDYFAIYASMALITVCGIKFMYDWRDGVIVTRYKSSYTVLREKDPISRMYPREFITDKHLLTDDHPTKIEECDQLPKGAPVFEGTLYQRLSLLLK